jgi:hypothetical protein
MTVSVSTLIFGSLKMRIIFGLVEELLAAQGAICYVVLGGVDCIDVAADCDQ